MLIWRDVKRVETFRPLNELNSEILSRNYFPKLKLHRGNSGLRINMNSKLYYDPSKLSAFSNFEKMQEAARLSKLRKNPGEIISWLEMHDNYNIILTAEMNIS